MIANYVNDQKDTWDQFLREFAYAIRAAVNETTRKTPVELFLGRKLITTFQKLVMVSDGTAFAIGDIERLFEEAGGNTKAKHEKWGKSYNRCRRDVQIKKQKLNKKETVTPSTSSYSLRPRSGRRVESRPTKEMKTHQRGPVRAGNSKGKQYSPYIEEEARSGNKNTRRRGNQQQKDQERKEGTNTSRIISMEVLVGDANYKS
ncbi:uncharacterized protein TNCV_157121 [Trichonephila clavipes]|nr:uncharacterized protein TNCV_157121 [Trichonephila clavipes]